MFKIEIKSIFVYISICTFIAIIYSLIFQYLMIIYEHKDFDFITAFYWVIVSMTTVGYGDIYFNSTIGHLFSAIVILSGVVMIFGVFPFFITPHIEKIFRNKFPTIAPIDLKNHIIICGYNQLVETLILELEEDKIPFIIVDNIEKNINLLISKKVLCIYGDAEDDSVLLNSNILSARMLIANESDERNAYIILTAKELCDVKSIALVENMAREGFLKYAGADRVISPKTLFGIYIGRKAIDPLTDHLAGATKFFDNLNIVEFPIHSGSSLIGKKLKDTKIHIRTGANIVGLWAGGRLSLSPKPEDVIKENSIILAVGKEKQLEILKSMTW